MLKDQRNSSQEGGEITEVKLVCERLTISREVTSWTRLSSDFAPSNGDVIVGTGREAKYHKGNALFREMLKLYIKRYSSARTKFIKTLIISEIVETVRERSPTGSGFVKKVCGGQWYAVDDHQAREKVSQGLRDILHGQYQSSARTKKQKRNELCAEMQRSVDEMMQAKSSFLSKCMETLSLELSRLGKNKAEKDVEALFTQTNIAILEELKKIEESPTTSNVVVKVPV